MPPIFFFCYQRDAHGKIETIIQRNRLKGEAASPMPGIMRRANSGGIVMPGRNRGVAREAVAVVSLAPAPNAKRAMSQQ
jgi:hypothetical protein